MFIISYHLFVYTGTAMNPQEDFQIGLNRSQKFTLGIVLLILVDIIWVASSELTKVRQNYMHNSSMRLMCYFNFAVLVRRRSLPKAPIYHLCQNFYVLHIPAWFPGVFSLERYVHLGFIKFLCGKK